MLGELQSPMVVTVSAVAKMQVPADEVVDVISMRHGLVTAAGTVTVAGIMTAAGVGRCAGSRIR
jgi:hypothetical protein